MEKLGLRCFLQLVQKTSQSHEVQLIYSIFKEPGWNKKICYLETIQQSRYGRMMMVILLDVINTTYAILLMTVYKYALTLRV